MRTTLVEWIITVSDDHRLLPETLFLAIDYLDRFCSIRNVPSQQYQLLGLTCLWVASKYEELPRAVPSLDTLVGDCCGIYSKRDFKAMEFVILKELDFRLGYPTRATFFTINAGVVGLIDRDTIQMGRKLLVETLKHPHLLVFNNTIVATACIVVVSSKLRKMIKEENVVVTAAMRHIEEMANNMW